MVAFWIKSPDRLTDLDGVNKTTANNNNNNNNNNTTNNNNINNSSNNNNLSNHNSNNNNINCTNIGPNSIITNGNNNNNSNICNQNNNQSTNNSISIGAAIGGISNNNNNISISNNNSIGPNDISSAIKKMKTELRSCAACGEPISDRYFLEVGGCSWHGSCLRCCVCLSPLDRQQSCFLRERQVYCKSDYAKNFGAKCSKCCRGISASDWVRRARELVFHLACFACDQCGRQLSTGEQFALMDDRVLCKAHYLETIEGGTTSSDEGCDGDGYHKSKTKRVRTTFTEEQLQVLQANFQIDSNPDGQDLERIASVTGLSKRVTQVWFQNSRARQKKHIHAGKNKMREPDGNNSFARHINLQLSYSFQNNSQNSIPLNGSKGSSLFQSHESSMDELSQDSSLHCMQNEV